MLDSNVFIAGIKNPRKQTGTLKLLLSLIEDSNIELVGDELLVEEMLRYAELLHSPTATTMVAALMGKTTIVRTTENFRKICKTYIDTPDKADVLHAATCLQTGAIMISNDRHFDRIRKQRIIEVWTITEAIKALRPSN